VGHEDGDEVTLTPEQEAEALAQIRAWQERLARLTPAQLEAAYQAALEREHD
jgi:hypothetical protein